MSRVLQDETPTASAKHSCYPLDRNVACRRRLLTARSQHLAQACGRELAMEALADREAAEELGAFTGIGLLRRERVLERAVDGRHQKPIPPSRPVWPRRRRKWSARTQAIMASPIGTARMPTHGSWRPLVMTSVFSLWMVTLSRGVRMDAVGFTAKRTTTGSPFEMPPRMPPAWFDLKRGPLLLARISSAFSVPVSAAAAIPSPISTPFTALIDIMAEARSALSLP